MLVSSKCCLQAAVFGFMLLPNAADDLPASEANLEDYMRFTPEPVSHGDATSPPTSEPSAGSTDPRPTRPAFVSSDAPTPAHIRTPSLPLSQAKKTSVPTHFPTEAPTSSALWESPTTTAPTDYSTTPPSKHALRPVTERSTESPSVTPTETAVAVSGDTENKEPWGLFSETLEYQLGVGEVHVDFSLYSPSITNLTMNFMKVKMGVYGSIDVLVCDQSHAIKEQGHEFCAVRDDVLLSDGGSEFRQNSSKHTQFDVTVMALASTNVKDGSGVIRGSTSISWTTWRMSYNVIQLGPALRQHINESYGPDFDESEISVKGLSLLQKMMSVNMKRTLKNGVFEHDVNAFVKDVLILASVVGEEVHTYEPIVAHFGSPDYLGPELETGEDGLVGGMMVVLFFAGLGVACFVIVTLLYFSFRSRGSAVRRKRTIVVLDETRKSCTDSQESTADKVVPLDKHDLGGAPPLQQENTDERWGGSSSVGATSSVGAGDAEADVESQWGRSMAQSSAYTGSISAITGVSGLEQSDTWSVGSMSIDLAEWG